MTVRFTLINLWHKRRRENELKPQLLARVDDGSALSKGVTFGLDVNTIKRTSFIILLKF